MREKFLDELAGIVQRAKITPNADEGYSTRDGVGIFPSQLEDAVKVWAEHGVAIEFRPLLGKPGAIELVAQRGAGANDGE